MRENLNYFEFDSPDARRGPRVGPTPTEAVLLPEMKEQRQKFYDGQIEAMQVGCTDAEDAAKQFCNLGGVSLLAPSFNSSGLR